MKLVDALRLKQPASVAFSGAGGKTTSLFRLARELPGPVIVTATTHLGESQLLLADRVVIVDDPTNITPKSIDANGINLFIGAALESDRRAGLSGSALETVRQLAQASGAWLLVEADGSRQLPLKAPAAHEPVIPEWADGVVVVAGLSGLGKPLSPEWVHRPELFAALSGLAFGEPVTPEGLARVLVHSQGGLKGMPPGARKIALLNQADDDLLFDLGEALAERLLPAFETALVARVGVNEPDPVRARLERTAGIVLAAGGSSRLNSPKQLLDWHGQPFARVAAQKAVDAGLSPVVVVTGASGEEVAEVLAGLDVTIVNNPDWPLGQSTSIQAGLNALAGEAVGAAVFLLSDQPQVPVRLIKKLVQAQRRTGMALAAPRVGVRRANPVLFDRVTFDDLMNLRGDTGGRGLFERYPAAWVDWDDPELLLDVDTWEDYERLKAAAAKDDRRPE